MNVRLMGFPAAVDDTCFQVDTNITSINSESFCVAALSAPGLSGGAVVATLMGQIVGVVGGAIDARKGREIKRFVAFAIPAHSLPARPSSQPSSPEERAPAKPREADK